MDSATLKNAPEPVFRIWRNRLKIEYQAASLFGQLGDELSQIYGEQDPVMRLCEEAEQEELRHAHMCIEIIEYSGEKISFEYKRENIELGPQDLTQKQRILYTALALGCVTETLSAALLTEMQKCAEEGIIKNTIHQILKDEVKHSRIGWAILNRENQQQTLKWIQPYIHLMIKESLHGDIEPMLSKDEAQIELHPWGILSPQDAKTITQATIDEIIRPGLNQFSLTC